MDRYGLEKVKGDYLSLRAREAVTLKFNISVDPYSPEGEYFVSLRLTENGVSRAAKSNGGVMNYTGWIAVVIAVLQVIKETMDD